MIRYLSSFIITLVLYSTVIGLFLFVYVNQKVVEPKEIKKRIVSLKHIVVIKKEEKTKILKKKIIEPLHEVVKKELIVEKPLPKIEEVLTRIKPKKKKIKKVKKIVKKKIKKKAIKKVTKKKIIPKKKFPEVIVKKDPILPVLKNYVKREKIVNIAPLINYKEDFLKKNLLLIKKHIQKHIKYSKRARKLSIQGIVLVEFKLLKDGSITNIRALDGHKMLRRSTIKAIKKASIYFPTVSKNITLKIPIEYKLI